MKNNIIVSAGLLDQMYKLAEISWRDFVILAQNIDFEEGKSYFKLCGYMKHRIDNVAELGFVTTNMKDAYAFMILLSNPPPVSVFESVFEGLASPKKHVQVIAKDIGRRTIQKGLSFGNIQALLSRANPGSEDFISEDIFYRDTIRHWLLDYYIEFVTVKMLESWSGSTDLELRARVEILLASQSEFKGPHAELCESIIKEFSQQPAVA